MGAPTIAFIFWGVVVLILQECKGDNALKNEGPVDKAHHIKDKEVKKLLQEQVNAELNASMVYLAMAAFFGDEKQNRDGFAQFFKKSAQEEFEHAQKFINYMNKRGVLLVKENLKMTTNRVHWNHGLNALEDALALEGEVTRKIKKIHEKAKDDGHLTNFLESVFLEEQVDSMRLLSGYVNNLKAMAKKSETDYDYLAEYLFDLQLQGKKMEL